jgi:hypothetical protein
MLCCKLAELQCQDSDTLFLCNRVLGFRVLINLIQAHVEDTTSLWRLRLREDKLRYFHSESNAEIMRDCLLSLEAEGLSTLT